MTTGGSPKPVLKAVSRRLRPRNEDTATHVPIGTPGTTLATLAVIEMKSDCRMMTHVSRSEEHTSELQSHLNLVCRLLLEKKKAADGPASRTPRVLLESAQSNLRRG